MFRRIGPCLALALLLPAMLRAELPKQLVNATWFHVVTTDGLDEYSPRINPEDRIAVLAVKKALIKWDHYHAGTRASMGEPSGGLLIVVRPGRQVGTNVDVTVHRAPSGPQKPDRTVGVGYGYGVDLGDKDDTMSVFYAPFGTDSGPLWQRSARFGLFDRTGQTTDVPLVKQFIEDVEKAAAEQAAKDAEKKSKKKP